MNKLCLNILHSIPYRKQLFELLEHKWNEHITLELQSLSGWSEEVTLSYHIKLILKFMPVIPWF